MKTLNRIKYLLVLWKNKQIHGSSLESLIFRYVSNDTGLLEELASLVENEFENQKKADRLRQSLQPESKKKTDLE